MAQATETFALGGTQVTTVVEIDLNTVWLISGNFAGTIPAGQVGFINGDVNLTGDLIVEGLLTGIDTFTLTGNGFQILGQNGGQLNLQGIEKSSWIPWGETPVNWQTGDLITVAPTVAGIFVPFAWNWTGNWPARPINSPDVTLPDGQVVKPEVANLTRSIILKNLSRIHFHDEAGVQTLKHLAVVDSGITNVLAQYPIHFHLNGEASRGSLVEGVVVQNGKNHAFVVHGSHGVTLRNCVAYNTFQDAYWWDLPFPPLSTTNNSNDIVYDHCLAMYVRPSVGANQTRLSAFLLGAGSGNSVINSVATCVQGSAQASGFHWPEQVNNNPGGVVWEFHHNTFHNNKINGIFVWQNDFHPHVIEDFIGYHNGTCQIDHGAYENVYHYRRGVLKGGLFGFRLHAVGGLIVEDVISDTRLLITKHLISAVNFATVRNCSWPFVTYNEMNDGGFRHSKMRYDDCGLAPVSYGSMAAAIATTIAEIYEDGNLMYRWNQGVWT